MGHMGGVVYEFGERLEFSLGKQQDCDKQTIQRMIPGCVSVDDASQLLNTNGVDYVATLRKGAVILIDAKTRDKGCSRFWKAKEPEFALETWSVRPGGRFGTPECRAKTGWTLCEAKNVDLILFKFDPSDSEDVFLVCFQLLRAAFRTHLPEWRTKYKVDVQSSRSWQSECVFVPEGVVHAAIRRVSIGRRAA
jgi:hypothetical protein